MVGRNGAFCLAPDRRGGQFTKQRTTFLLVSANHFVQSLLFADLLLSVFVCDVSSIREAVLMELDPVGWRKKCILS